MKHVFCILDKSGSMDIVRKSTISGFNEYLQDLKREGGDTRFSLTLFDTTFEQRYENTPINKVEALDRCDYEPSGATALVDAVCETLNTQKHHVKKRDKALVIIITDGEENSSRMHNSNEMRELVQSLQAKDNWTFVYLGANQNAWHTARQYGFVHDNVATYNSTEKGTAAAFTTMSSASLGYMRSAGASTTAFFSKEDKDKLKDTK